MTLVKTVEEAAILTTFVAGIGWIGKKVIKEDLTGNPASSVMNYVKMIGVVAGSLFLKDYL
jgi:hypothetical protein